MNAAKNALHRFLNYGRVFPYHRHSTDPYADAEKAIEEINASMAKEKA